MFCLQLWFGCFEMKLYVVLIFPANNCQIVFTIILDSSSISCLKHIIWIHTIVDVLASFPWILPHKSILNTEKAEDFLQQDLCCAYPCCFWSVPLSGQLGKKVGDPQRLLLPTVGGVARVAQMMRIPTPNFHSSGMVQDLGVSKK